MKTIVFTSEISEPLTFSKVDDLNVTQPGDQDQISINCSNDLAKKFGILVDVTCEGEAVDYIIYKYDLGLEEVQDERLSGVDFNNDNDKLDVKMNIKASVTGSEFGANVYTSKGGPSGTITLTFDLHRKPPY